MLYHPVKPMASVEDIDLITLVVTDQDEALDFYVDTLGFELIQKEEYPDGRQWIEISPPDSAVKLAVKTPEMFDGEEAEHRRALIGASPQITYRVDDCMALCDSLQDHGVTVDDGPSTKPWGIQAVVRDPSGNQIVLTEEVNS
jgi:catechol 2,3-dioxygenase-like lactoylglutathione lyase family enzyme